MEAAVVAVAVGPDSDIAEESAASGELQSGSSVVEEHFQTAMAGLQSPWAGAASAEVGSQLTGSAEDILYSSAALELGHSRSGSD